MEPIPRRLTLLKFGAMSEKVATADSFFASATRTWAAAKTCASKLKSSVSMGMLMLAALVLAFDA